MRPPVGGLDQCLDLDLKPQFWKVPPNQTNEREADIREAWSHESNPIPKELLHPFETLAFKISIPGKVIGKERTC